MDSDEPREIRDLSLWIVLYIVLAVIGAFLALVITLSYLVDSDNRLTLDHFRDGQREGLGDGKW